MEELWNIYHEQSENIYRVITCQRGVGNPVRVSWSQISPNCWQTFSFQLLRTARRLLGEKLFRGLMKRTMYGQFLAGEDRTTVLASAARHRKHDVIPMFAYTAKEFHGIKG